jgi:hypothetical protein
VCDGAGSCLQNPPPPAGTACSDGNACNGDETCDGFASCLGGTPPALDDHNACTADACDATTGVTHTAVPDGTRCNGTGVCTAGTCSVTAHTLYAISESTKHLERIDPDTLAVTDIGPLNVPYAFGDCMFNPEDSTLYMIDGRGSNGLYRVDLATGNATLIGSDGVNAMEALAFHPPSHKIFAMSFDAPQSFYEMNARTGAATPLGSIGFGFQGMAWDSTRNMMVGYNGSQLSSIDVTNGAMTPLATTEFVNNFGMTYDPVIDRFWIVDDVGRIIQVDPNIGYQETLSTFIPGGRTCVASVPVP